MTAGRDGRRQTPAPQRTCVASRGTSRGRMGHRESHVYLANAYVAGAAAVTGEIVDPAEVLGR